MSNLTPTAFLIDFVEDFGQVPILIVATKYKNQTPILWAVKKRHSCMSKEYGQFYSEPQNSAKDRAYFDEFRFSSVEEAEKCYSKFYKNQKK